MLKLKTFCLSLLVFFFFVNCSIAQEESSNSSPSNKDKKLSTSKPKTDSKTKGFESKEGNFFINISRPPLQTYDFGSEEIKQKGIDLGKTYVWQSETIIYTAMYMLPFDENGSPMTIEFNDINVGVRKGILRQSGKLNSEKEIFYAKNPGREFNYISSNGVNLIGRTYLIDKIGYQIVGGFSDEKDEKEVLEVLDSFRLLKKPDVR